MKSARKLKKKWSAQDMSVLRLARYDIYKPDLPAEVLVEHRLMELQQLKETRHTEVVFHGIYRTAR